VVRIHRRYVGCGPTKAQAFFRDDVVVVVLGEVLTRAGHTVAAHGQPGTVRQERDALQSAMRADIVDALETLTGARVQAVLADIDVEHDVAFEMFMLDRPVQVEPAPNAVHHLTDEPWRGLREESVQARRRASALRRESANVNARAAELWRGSPAAKAP
jgi:uncharacterized protein YbcI